MQINSNNCYLILAQEQDAEDIYKLRSSSINDGKLNNKDSSVILQKQWLSEYLLTRYGVTEYYFLIKDYSHNTIGTIRIYDIKDGHVFTWGSWIISQLAHSNTAIESCCAIYYYAFEILNLDYSTFSVNKSNKTVHAFHLRSGASLISEEDESRKYKFDKNDYITFKKKYLRFFPQQD